MSDPLRLKRAVYWSALPRTLSYRQRFALALKAGFAGVETLTTKDPAQVEAIAEAAAETGLEIPTVINGGSWRYRLFSDERSEVDQAVDSILTTLDNARRWGAGAIQIIPAYGQGGVALPEAYRRTQQVIRERVLPVAESYGIVCGVENAWYSLVPGPLAYLRFIDEFESAYLQAFLDTGNMIFGHVDEWIRLAGPRIIRLHLKDFLLEQGGRLSPGPGGSFSFRPIGDGGVEWPKVSAALREVGYQGWGTAGGSSHSWAGYLAGKVLSKLGRRVTRVPGGEWVHGRLQAALSLASLKDATRRLDRHLQV